MRYLFTFLLTLTAKLAQAQCCPYVQPVQVLPANPTDSDDIRLVFRATTGGSGSKISTSFSRTGNNFTFTGCYFNGFPAMPKGYVDTVQVGRLPAGSYSITFIAKESSNSQQCVEQQRNGNSRTFRVSGATLGINNPTEQATTLFPVPATDRQLAFRAVDGNTVATFQLFDASGRPCYTRAADAVPYQNKHFQLNLPQLPAGAYTLRVQRADTAPTTHRVVLQ